MLKDLGINVLQLVTGTEVKNEILDGIWIGNHRSSMDGDFLQKERINVVFNCTRDHPFFNYTSIRYRLDVHDRASDLLRMRKKIDWASYMLNRHMQKGDRILIHCHAGLQRSATLLAYTLIRYKQMTMKDAVSLIRSRRPMAFPPMFTFQKILRNAEKKFTMNDPSI